MYTAHSNRMKKLNIRSYRFFKGFFNALRSFTQQCLLQMRRSSTYICLKLLIAASLCAAFNTRYRRPCCVNKMSTRCVCIVCSQVVDKFLINAWLFKTTSYKVFELHRLVPSVFFRQKTHLRLVFTYVFTQDNFPTNPNGQKGFLSMQS